MRVRFPHVTITTNSELYFPLTMFISFDHYFYLTENLFETCVKMIKLYLKILWKIVLTIVQN